jgi:NADPH:quinone reductase-like Zn-dependent oxidoreductase
LHCVIYGVPNIVSVCHAVHLFAVGKDTFEASLKSLDYLGWLVSFGNASGKPDPLDVLR